MKVLANHAPKPGLPYGLFQAGMGSSFRLLSMLVLSLALLPQLVGCGADAGAESTNLATKGGGGLAQSSASSALWQGPLPFTANSSVLHGGNRIVTTCTYDDPANPVTTSFREAVVFDGKGQYSIEATDALTAVSPDWTTFALIQEIRQGLIHRYRDFAVRDEARFHSSWTLQAQPGTRTVAGVVCNRYLCVHRTADARSFDLAVDPATGLVLRAEERDAQRRTLSITEYETLDTNPNLAAVVWYQPRIDQPLDLTQDLASQLGWTPFEPGVLPPGYGLQEAETLQVSDSSGQLSTWLKLTYTDGVDPLFFLMQAPARRAGSVQIAGAQAVKRDGDTAVVVDVGRALAIHAEVGAHTLILVGLVEEDQLLDMLESSLP